MNGFMCEKCKEKESTSEIRGWYVCEDCYIEMLNWDNKNKNNVKEDKNMSDLKINGGICDCTKPYECCELCCQNFKNDMVHNACKYQENRYGVPTLPGYKPVEGINYKTIPVVKVGIITKLLYLVGYHETFKGDEFMNEKREG